MSRSATTTTDTEVSADRFAHDLSDRFLQCRDFGHNWRPWTVDFDRKAKSYFRQLRCVSCKTVRSQLLDSSGHVLTNSYKYPDGYIAHLQPGTYSRDVFRAEGLIRFLEKNSPVGKAS